MTQTPTSLSIDAAQIVKLSALTSTSIKAIRNFYGGRRTRATTRARLTEGARILGLPLPGELGQ